MSWQLAADMSWIQWDTELAYLANLRAEAPARPPSGALLYGTSGNSFCRRYSLLGFPVTVRAIDLDSRWERVRSDMLEILDELWAARGLSNLDVGTPVQWSDTLS